VLAVPLWANPWKNLAVLDSFDAEPKHVAAFFQQLFVGLLNVVSEQSQLIVAFPHGFLQLRVDD